MQHFLLPLHMPKTSRENSGLDCSNRNQKQVTKRSMAVLQFHVAVLVQLRKIPKSQLTLPAFPLTVEMGHNLS